jgi:DNA-binding protein YbaB
MFDNIKKLHELKKLQDSFKKEKLTFNDRGVSVVMNGNFEVEEIILNPELTIQEQQEVLKHCLNMVREDIQKTLAKKMMGSGINF